MSPAAAPATRGIVLRHAAALYDWLDPAMAGWRHRAIARATADALAPRPGDSILDVGCATGRLTAEVGRRLQGGSVVGIDASPEMIAVARRRRADARCRFEIAVGEAAPFADDSFDGVVSSLFFHHLDRALKARVAGEILRVLRPGGRIALCDIDRPWSPFGWLWGGAGWVIFRQPEIMENLRGEWPRALAEAGFANLESRRVTLGCVRVWTGEKAR